MNAKNKNSLSNASHFNRPGWTKFSEATREDILAHETADKRFASQLGERILEHLKGLSFRGDNSALPVDRLIHSLQTATRAYRDGKDEEYVICCLVHDIGDLLSPFRHAHLAAIILEPFVSEANFWMVKNHPVFQGYHYFHHLGFDRNARDKFKEHPHYQRALEFSEYDQASFDPNYDTLPLEFFAPMVKRFFSRPPKWAQGGDGMTGSEVRGLI